MREPDEPRTWTESDADRVIEDLRNQMKSAKARARDMRQGIAATGRTPSATDTDSAPTAAAVRGTLGIPRR